MVSLPVRDNAIGMRVLPPIHPDDHPPRPGAVEFAEEDALPGAEEQAGALNENRHRASHERGLDVGVSIALGVAVLGVGPGDELIQIHEDVRRPIRCVTSAIG